MKKLRINKKTLFLIASSIVVLLLFAGVLVRIRNIKSALRIESEPGAIVYIDGEQKGTTPLEIESPKRNILVKLLPTNINQDISPYETSVKLTPGVKSILRHKFAPSGFSQTEIISYEKTTRGETSLAVVTIPDGARVSLDSQEKGVTPLRVDYVVPGTHRIDVDSFGFAPTSFEIQTTENYIVTAFVDLAKDETETSEEVLSKNAEIDEEPEDSPEPIYPYVYILDTPTGFLRIREKAGIDGLEVGRATPGEYYDVISFDAEEGWYEIEFESDLEGLLTEVGWVSARYASPSAEKR